LAMPRLSFSGAKHLSHAGVDSAVLGCAVGEEQYQPALGFCALV
jgi:hypothetical protein